MIDLPSRRCGRDRPQRPRQAQRALARRAGRSGCRVRRAEASGVRALVLRGEGRAFCAGPRHRRRRPRDRRRPGVSDAVESRSCAGSRPSRRRRSPPCRARASASGSDSRSRPTSSTSPRTPRSGRRSSASARCSTPAGTRCSTSGSARTARSTSSTPGELMSGAEAVAAGLFSRAVSPATSSLEFTRDARGAGRARPDPGVPRLQAADAAAARRAAGPVAVVAPRTPRRPRCATAPTTARASPRSRRSAPRSSRLTGVRPVRHAAGGGQRGLIPSNATVRMSWVSASRSLRAGRPIPLDRRVEHAEDEPYETSAAVDIRPHRPVRTAPRAPATPSGDRTHDAG